MTGPGSVATTGSLLEAVVRLGARASAGPEPQAPAEPPLTPVRWAYRLCGFYQTTRVTPPLMREAAARFAGAGRAALHRWAEVKAREEHGHDALALRDLHDLGYDAEAVVQAVVPPVQAALVRSFEQLVRADDPVGCVGYAYALERLALDVGADEIARVEAALPRAVRATRCLRVHSAAGSDREHVRETVQLVAGLSPEERSRIAAAAYETAALCHARPAGEPAGEEVLERLLSPFRRRSNETRRAS
jgi:hypothetical protein